MDRINETSFRAHQHHSFTINQSHCCLVTGDTVLSLWKPLGSAESVGKQSQQVEMS